jgi:hypothetical protein
MKSTIESPGKPDTMKENTDGEIRLYWNKVKAAEYYVVEYRGLRSDEKWKQADFVSCTACIITGLKKNRNYKFRVAALNGSRRSKWSKTLEIKL